MGVTVRIVIALVAAGGVVAVLPFVLARGGSYPVAVAVALAAGYVLIAGVVILQVVLFSAPRRRREALLSERLGMRVRSVYLVPELLAVLDGAGERLGPFAESASIVVTDGAVEFWVDERSPRRVGPFALIDDQVRHHQGGDVIARWEVSIDGVWVPLVVTGRLMGVDESAGEALGRQLSHRSGNAAEGS